MTKHENGSSGGWDCDDDYEEEPSSWVLFEAQRPEDGQKCLVWPTEQVLTYDASLDGFVSPRLYQTDNRKIEYWMPFPDAPKSAEKHAMDTLEAIFCDQMQPLIGETVSTFKDNLLAALGIPAEMMDASEPPRVTNVTDKGNGEVEFDLELPVPPTRYSGTYAAEDDTDGNDR